MRRPDIPKDKTTVEMPFGSPRAELRLPEDSPYPRVDAFSERQVDLLIRAHMAESLGPLPKELSDEDLDREIRRRFGDHGGSSGPRRPSALAIGAGLKLWDDGWRQLEGGATCPPGTEWLTQKQRDAWWQGRDAAMRFAIGDAVFVPEDE